MKYLSIYILLIISIQVSAQQTKLMEKSETEPFTIVEQMPEFPGGEDGLIKFLGRNIKYPAYAQENDIKGTVLANFVVCEDGSICQLKIAKSPDTSLNRAAMEVLSKMPNWKPGKQSGKNVRVYFDVPIVFTFEDDSKIVKPNLNDFIELELSKNDIMNFSFLEKKSNEFKYYTGDEKPIKADSKSKIKKFLKKIQESYQQVYFIYDVKLIGDPSIINQKYKITIK